MNEALKAQNSVRLTPKANVSQNIANHITEIRIQGLVRKANNNKSCLVNITGTYRPVNFICTNTIQVKIKFFAISNFAKSTTELRRYNPY